MKLTIWQIYDIAGNTVLLIGKVNYWLSEGPGPTGVWLKYCDTAGKTGRKGRKQILT